MKEKNRLCSFILTAALMLLFMTLSVYAGPVGQTTISVEAGSGKKVKVKAASVTGANWYQYQISTDAGFSSVLQNRKSRKLSTTFRNLKPGTSYYVRARAYYKPLSGKRTFGAWSLSASVQAEGESTDPQQGQIQTQNQVQSQAQNQEKIHAGFYRKVGKSGTTQMKQIYLCTLGEDGKAVDSYLIFSEADIPAFMGEIRFSATLLKNGHYYCNTGFRSTDPLEVTYTVFSVDSGVRLIRGLYSWADCGSFDGGTSVQIREYVPAGRIDEGGKLLSSWQYPVTIGQVKDKYADVLKEYMAGEGLTFAFTERYGDTTYFTAKKSEGSLLYDNVLWESLPVMP